MWRGGVGSTYVRHRHAWGGNGPVPGLPLFILTHSVPAEVPETTVPYTFVTDGIESAIKQAQAAAGDKYVALTGSQATQQALRAGLLDEIQLSVGADAARRGRAAVRPHRRTGAARDS